jgi:hypothetical protein
VSGDQTWRQAKDGDEVEGLTDDRDALLVVGTINLTLSDSARHLQVTVSSPDGGWAGVRPSSVKVITAGQRSERGWPGTLGEAFDVQLLGAEWDQPGGSWNDLDGQADVRLAPLVERRWEVTGRTRYPSWEHLDSVMVDLCREGDEIEFEFYCDGGVTAWPTTDPDEDDAVEPLWRASGDFAELFGRYQEAGWL